MKSKFEPKAHLPGRDLSLPRLATGEIVLLPSQTIHHSPPIQPQPQMSAADHAAQQKALATLTASAASFKGLPRLAPTEPGAVVVVGRIVDGKLVMGTGETQHHAIRSAFDYRR